MRVVYSSLGWVEYRRSTPPILTQEANQSNMALGGLWCFGSPGVEDEWRPLVDEDGPAYSSMEEEEKAVTEEVADEDEMQGRLKDLREEIKKAEVDW